MLAAWVYSVQTIMTEKTCSQSLKEVDSVLILSFHAYA